MAKRAAPNEEPFRPLLDIGLVSSALSQPISPQASRVESAPPAASKVLGLSRSEVSRKIEIDRRASPEADAPSRAHADAPARPVVEKFDCEKRILFTRTETNAIDRLVASLATRLHAQVKVSHLIRALVMLVLNAESELDQRAGEKGPLVRPPNGDAHALERFEQQIAEIIGAALRDAGPIRGH